jgi:hypothetical protein
MNVYHQSAHKAPYSWLERFINYRHQTESHIEWDEVLTAVTIKMMSCVLAQCVFFPMQTPNVSEKNAVSIFRAEGQGWEVMTYRI